ncbi:O-antigen ligase family protein [Lichenifustis flavocetrariae]|uniref:O-antigen ligase family protein n=1 Tax=Lichenifustis flavocetrariae TaxID=2949735 RepID=A0AA41YU16_9HYPH|nr:O-antigen ligase family protein [Lichenifustis flavocetrariae]MCW6508571.1 O-antigen ligase family protein [Lichenifustis flavocetrariae]
MSMLSSVLATTGWAARKTLIAGSLAFIGLVVGVGCVLFPAGVPFGIVGLAGLILLWTLPDLRSVPSRLARRSFVPFLVATVCTPFYLAIIIPGVPFISVRRFFLYIFVGALVITICGSSKYRTLLINRLKAAPLLFYMTAGYYALIVATFPVSVAPSSTINVLVQYTMTWYLPFLAVIIFVEKGANIVGLLKVMLFCMIIDFVLGGIEFHVQKPFMFQLLPASSRAYIIENTPMYAGAETGSFRDGIYRATAAYSIGLSWAEMVAMVAPVAAYFLIHGDSGRHRLLGLVSFIAGFLSLTYSGSRGGYVCSMVALSVFLIIWAIRKIRLHPESLSGGIALFLTSGTVTIVAAAVTFVNKFHVMVFGNGTTQLSDQGRVQQWATAWPKIFQSPLWGHGFGTASVAGEFVTGGRGQATMDDYRINLLLDNGVLGFGLFFGMIAVAVWISFRIYITNKSPLAATGAAIGCALIAYAVDRTTTSQTENNTLLLILIGLVFALQRVTTSGNTAPEQVNYRTGAP